MNGGEACALVDLDRLSSWMDRAGLPGGVIEQPTLLTGGTQNVLLRFTRAGRGYVLRRPPPHSIANGGETMRREARVLGALAGSDVPHPGLIAACVDEAVIGAVFYLMEPINGFNASVTLPPHHAADPAIRRAMGFALVDGLLALGRIDPFAVGLGDFGRLDGYLTRQASRWRRQYRDYARNDGWRLDSLCGVDELHDWIERHCPAEFTPGILHGDYHLANVMFRHDGPELAAIVDWELASLGDPLIDLGWLMATWPDPAAGEPPLIAVEPWCGFPDADELVAYYSARSTRDLSQLRWYTVLACYKLGILLEGSHARAAAGKADPAIGRRLHDQATTLFRRAIRAAGGVLSGGCPLAGLPVRAAAVGAS